MERILPNQQYKFSIFFSLFVCLLPPYTFVHKQPDDDHLEHQIKASHWSRLCIFAAVRQFLPLPNHSRNRHEATTPIGVSECPQLKIASFLLPGWHSPATFMDDA